MKKFLALAMAMIMAVCCLAGCGGNKDPEPTDDSNVEVTDPVETPDVSEDVDVETPEVLDLAKAFEDIMAAAEEAPAMMELEGELLDAAYPGLSELELNQCVINTAAISAVASEFAFVEVKDAADAETVKEIFQSRIDTQIESGAFYPATVEMWQTSSAIYEDGNVIMLFCAENAQTMIEAISNGTEMPAWALAPEADAETPSEDVEMPEIPVDGSGSGSDGSTSKDAPVEESGMGADDSLSDDAIVEELAATTEAPAN